MTTPYQLLPPLTDEEQAALRNDIAEHGVQQPIIVDEHGTVIDGHHREAIARELGVACPRSVYPGYSEEQKRSLALRLNIHRRQLSRDQRNALIVTLRNEGMTQEDIAREVGVTQQTVSNVLNTNSCNEDAFPTIVNSRGQVRPSRYERQGSDVDDDPSFAPGEPEAIIDTLREAHGDDLTADHVEQAIEENLESKRLPDPPKAEWQPTKPDLGDGISHPARYSAELVELFRQLLAEYGLPCDTILDPFAGPGGVHDLQDDGWSTVGVELEPEWANLHADTIQGSALDLPFDSESFGAIVTSPTYGNRLADSHNASDPERRRSYTHDLGHPLSAENSGDIHWRTTGPGTEARGSLDYRTFHEKAWDEAVLVLQPGGLFILNCCDHVRDGLVQPVTAWHCWALGRLGLDYLESRSVSTRKLRQGSNGELREQEQVHVFRKPS